MAICDCALLPRQRQFTIPIRQCGCGSIQRGSRVSQVLRMKENCRKYKPVVAVKTLGAGSGQRGERRGRPSPCSGSRKVLPLGKVCDKLVIADGPGSCVVSCDPGFGISAARLGFDECHSGERRERLSRAAFFTTRLFTGRLFVAAWRRVISDDSTMGLTDWPYRQRNCIGAGE